MLSTLAFLDKQKDDVCHFVFEMVPYFLQLLVTEAATGGVL